VTVFHLVGAVAVVVSGGLVLAALGWLLMFSAASVHRAYGAVLRWREGR
jgi:hypothetical protein